MMMVKTIKKAMDLLLDQGMDSVIYRIRRKAMHVYESLFFRPYVITKKISDETVDLLVSDLFAKHWYDRPEALDMWPELDWIKNNLIVEGDVVADCGANIGLTGIFFAKCVGASGRVIGFEALPANAENAKRNVHLNRITNFEIRHEALGACQGEIKFVNHPNGSVGEIDGLTSIIVPMIRLDDFFELNKPTFLKIDVEGYEIEVLKGAKEILKERPKLNIEIHCASFQNPIQSIRELFEILPLSDYKVFLQLSVGSPIIHYNPVEHTPDAISGYKNVQLFAITK